MNRLLRSRAVRALALVAVLAGLGGCSFLANEFQPLDATPPPPARVAGLAPGS
jgi:hypothetical protein